MPDNYNLKNPAVKRIMQEAKELATEWCYEYEAHPLEDNIFEWHFTVRGPADTEFEDGRYHGRILLPAEYPFKPPELIFLTPNGRFELNTKVCLSITGYHPEYWQPAWGIRTVILAVMGFFPTEARGAIGGLDYTKEERKVFAKKSGKWTCSVCDVPNDELLCDNAPRNQKLEDVSAFSLAYKKDQEQLQQPIEQPKEEGPVNHAPSSLPSQPPPTSSSSSSSSSSAPPSPQQQQQLTASCTASPSVVAPQASQTLGNIATRASPLWLDGLIGSLMMLIIALLIRRYVS